MGCSGSLPPKATVVFALHKRGQQAVAGQNAGEPGEKDCRQRLQPEIGGYGFYFTAAHCSQLFASAQTTDLKNPKLGYWRFFWRGSRQTQLHLPTVRATTQSQEVPGRFLNDILMDAIDAARTVWRSRRNADSGQYLSEGSQRVVRRGCHRGIRDAGIDGSPDCKAAFQRPADRHGDGARSGSRPATQCVTFRRK